MRAADAIREAYERAAREAAAAAAPAEREYRWTDVETGVERRATIAVAGLTPDVARERVNECEERALQAAYAERTRLIAERDAWLEALIRQERVRAAAHRAREAAAEALRAAEAGDLAKAASWAVQACDAEARAGLPSSWALLRQAIEAASSGNGAGGHAAAAPALAPEIARAAEVLAGALASRMHLRWTIVEDESGAQLAVADENGSLLVVPLPAAAGDAETLASLLERAYLVTPPPRER